MLKTIQIITLLQGFFLLLVLIKRKQEFKRLNFWLLVCAILSVQAYALGDDDFNLFVDNADWYFFYDILFITFFMLLIRYRKDKTGVFKRKDFLLFIPYFLFVLTQFIDNSIGLNREVIITVGVTSSVAMAGYLVYIFIKIIENKEKWIIYFMIPFTLMFVADRLSNVIMNQHDSIPFLESYGVIGLSAVLFYIILYKLILTPSDVIPKIEEKKYKISSIDKDQVERYKKQLIELFEKDRIYLNNKLTVSDVAKELKITRQQLSEILSMHLNTNFQDFLNTYRIEAFISCLKDPQYKNLTLLGVANQVGFNSKTSFYTTFKKIKGVTPAVYKKTKLDNL